MAPQLLLGCWEILRGKPGRWGGNGCCKGSAPRQPVLRWDCGSRGCLWIGSPLACKLGRPWNLSSGFRAPVPNAAPRSQRWRGAGRQGGQPGPGQRVPYSLCKEPGSGAWRPLGLRCSLCSQRPCATAVGLSLHFTCTCSQTLVPGGGGEAGGGGRARTPHVPSGPASLAARNPRTRRHPEQNSGTGLGKSEQNTSVAVSVRSP